MTQSNVENDMSIKVLYFASLKELLGRGEELVNDEGVSTVADIWQRVSEGASVSQQVLIAVNQEYATLETVVASGDEVAFFPPVTGG